MKDRTMDLSIDEADENMLGVVVKMATVDESPYLTTSNIEELH